MKQSTREAIREVVGKIGWRDAVCYQALYYLNAFIQFPYLLLCRLTGGYDWVRPLVGSKRFINSVVKRVQIRGEQ